MNNHRGFDKVESIYSCSESFWSKLNAKKKHRSDKHIEVVMSLGHIKEGDKHYDEDDNSYASDYSELLNDGIVDKEKSPKKLSNLTDSANRRKRTAEVSSEYPAEKIVSDLYYNKFSPIHHGFTYEHSLALAKYLTTKKFDSGK